MIVGAANGDGFADSELRQNRRSNRLVLNRVFDRSGRDDYRLTGHQARRRSDGADRAGIRQRKRRSLKVRNLQLAFARALDHLVVCFKEIRKGKLVGGFYIWNQERSRTVFLFQIDRDSEVDGSTFNTRGLTID